MDSSDIHPQNKSNDGIVKTESFSAALSIEEEVIRLETKLGSLQLETGDGTKTPLVGPFQAVLQNDIRISLKNLGICLQNMPDKKTSDVLKIHELLKKPLVKQKDLKADGENNYDDVSGILSYIKLLSEVCLPQQSQQESPCKKEQDIFWIQILEPIADDLLSFFNENVFKKSFEKLSASNVQNGDSGSNIDDTSTSQGVGFAFHHQLGILLKGVRILLICLKRAVVNLEGGQKLRNSVTDTLQNLTSLMDPLKATNYKTMADFDIGLDIRCNIGVGICYSMYYLCHPDKDRIQMFLKTVFTHTKQPEVSSAFVGGSPIEQEILRTCTSDMNRIALAFGILNTWLDQENDQDLYFSIGENILNIEHGVKEAVNLGSARVLEIWTDKLARPQIPLDVLKHVSKLFPSLEFFCFMYMPAHIDAVKNCCRNVLSSLSKIYDRLDEAKYPMISSLDNKETTWVASILKTILGKEPHIKWIPLACVVRNTKKASVLLELNPSLPFELLTTQRAFKAAANESYVGLMSYQFENSFSLIDWEKNWIDPLFATQPCQNNESNWPQKKNIISIILNSEKLRQAQFQGMISPLLKSVVKRMNKSEQGSFPVENEEENSLAETSLLAAETIKMAYELKIKIDPKELELVNVHDSSSAPEDSFRGLVPRVVLNSWLWSENPQIRLAGFALLIETKKTSDVISKQDFDSLKIFFKYNLLSQKPAFRQLFLSYFKKFTRRLKDGESVARRKRDSKTVQNYQGFVRWLWTFLTEDEGLFPGANFGRRCQSLDCVAELSQTFSNDFTIFGVTKSGNIKYLTWLTDSYENNKIQALDIILRMPMEEFEDETFCSNMFDEAVKLCKSIKPPDSITGRYLMTLLMRKCPNNSKYSPLNILESLYTELESLLTKIQTTSLIQVSSESPLYGCIRCIRMILGNTTEYKEAEKSIKYREYVERLLKLSFTIDETLFPVLGNAAPEGFILDGPVPENKQIVRSLAAQMLLVCAWRSMKEICLLMSDMCCWFVMEGESHLPSTKNFSLEVNLSINHILTFDQVSAIGDHLLYLLKNLMHRGVFEQVFVGFKLLATRLWKSNAPNLCHLPEKWLQNAMDQEHISAKSITRRSAGLPFIFQALLSAESDNEAFLHKWVQRLLIFDENPELSPIKIHSMNVLRGLFRDASFSAPMMPFVPHGLKMAFHGLKSRDWTERNSGLMLYGAVMRRSFGAKLNLMNAPTFFRKFPQMYDFLLMELDTCIQLIEKRNQKKEILREKKAGEILIQDSASLNCDFTFHLLLLLSSFTICGRVEDTHFKLAEFIPRIRKCGESDDMDVRKLSAKALVPFLISPEDKLELGNMILNDIDADTFDSQNRSHGLLLQFLAIFRLLSNGSMSTSKDDIETRALSIISQKIPLMTKSSPTIYSTLLEILSELKSESITNTLKLVQGHYEQRYSLSNSHRNFIPGLLIADKIIANSTIQILTNGLSTDDILEKMYGYFSDTSGKYLPYVNQFLELVEEDPCVKSKLALSNLLTKTDDIQVIVFAEVVIANYLRRVTSEFIKFPGTEVELLYLNYLDNVPSEIFKSLETEMVKSLISRCFQLCDEEQGKQMTTLHIKAAAMIVISKVAFSTEVELSQKDKTKLCDMILQWSASDVDDDMRFAVATSIPKVPFANMKSFSESNQSKLWSSVFLLAQDDESSLRQIINRKLSLSCGNACCDRKSLEMLVHVFIHEFLVQNPIEGLMILVGLLVREDFQVEAKAADDETEDRIFDKSEMNMYFEHEILAKTLKAEMQSFKARGHQLPDFNLNAFLSENQTDFFYALTNRSVESDKLSEKLSIKNILAFKLIDGDGSVDLVTNDPLDAIKNSGSNVVKHKIHNFLHEFFKTIVLTEQVQA